MSGEIVMATLQAIHVSPSPSYGATAATTF